MGDTECRIDRFAQRILAQSAIPNPQSRANLNGAYTNESGFGKSRTILKEVRRRNHKDRLPERLNGLNFPGTR